MNILAFSDWRSQPLEWILNVARQIKPDYILYAGDDVHRFVNLAPPLFVDDSGQFIEINARNIKDKRQLSILKKFLEQTAHVMEGANSEVKEVRLIPYGRFPSGKNWSDLVELEHFLVWVREGPARAYFSKLGAPICFVNGNDDFYRKVVDEKYGKTVSSIFMRGSDYFKILSTENGKLYFEKTRQIPDDDQFKNVLLPLTPQPTSGKILLSESKGAISVWGVGCHPGGLETYVAKAPTETADIFLSHIPPYGCLDLSTRFGVEHIGSRKLRRAVLKYKPKVVICGHSHFWGGNTAQLGDTTVINISSHDHKGASGNYAIINTKDWSIESNSIVPPRIYSTRGINTVKRKLEKMRDSPRAGKLLTYFWQQETDIRVDKFIKMIESLGFDIDLLKQRINSIKTKQLSIIQPMKHFPKNYAFVDVETGLARGGEPGELWLVGLMIHDQIKQFIFPRDTQRFRALLRSEKITHLVSWGRYDLYSLGPVIRRLRLKIKWIDACRRAGNACIWYTYKLSALYDALFGISDPDVPDSGITGAEAGIYADHLIFKKNRCPHCPPKGQIINEIKTKNRDDLIKMKRICEFLHFPMPSQRQNMTTSLLHKPYVWQNYQKWSFRVVM